MSKGESTGFDDLIEHVFAVNNINIDGDVTIEIRNVTAKQVIIDDIVWTSYTAPENAVRTPDLSVHSGLYVNAFNLSITTDTEEADIYYTIDGSEPTESSTKYTEALSISETTTVKARAFKYGMTTSSITSSTYTFPNKVSTIEELRAGVIDDLYILSNEVFIIYQQSSRNQKYIKDATGGICIDDADGVLTGSYELGDGISGIVGTLGSYNSLLQFVPELDIVESVTENNDITPVDVTVSELDADWGKYESTLVRLHVNFGDQAGSVLGASSSEHEVTDNNGGSILFRKNFHADNLDGYTLPAEALVTGIPIMSGSNKCVAPRDASDFNLSTKIDMPLEYDVSVYPNPFKSQLTVTSYNEIESVELINAIGQKVSQVAAVGGQINLNTVGLSPGVYLLKIKLVNGQSIVKKIMKQ